MVRGPLLLTLLGMVRRAADGLGYCIRRIKAWCSPAALRAARRKILTKSRGKVFCLNPESLIIVCVYGVSPFLREGKTTGAWKGMGYFLEGFNCNNRPSGAGRFWRRSLPVYPSCALGAGIRFLIRSSAAALLAALYATPCLADARPKAVSTWAFPAKGSKAKSGKLAKANQPSKAKKPPVINYQTPTPGNTLALQNVQAQQAAQRGLQQQLSHRQSFDQK
jgi:hypothetical protein